MWTHPTMASLTGLLESGKTNFSSNLCLSNRSPQHTCTWHLKVKVTCLRGVSCDIWWRTKIARESRETSQRTAWERKRGWEIHDKNELFQEGSHKEIQKKNSAKLPGCLNHRGKSTHCANKKNMPFSQCITPFQIHWCNGRNVPSCII